MQFRIGKKIGGGGIIGLLFLGFIIYSSLSQEFQLVFFPRYTIATVTQIYHTGHFVESVKFKYIVNSIEYERGANKLQKDVVEGKRYYVKFSHLNPKFNELLQEAPVPDSIKNAPTDGWEDIPKK